MKTKLEARVRFLEERLQPKPDLVKHWYRFGYEYCLARRLGQGVDEAIADMRAALNDVEVRRLVSLCDEAMLRVGNR